MHPIAFQIGDFAIRSYGVMAAVGFLLGCLAVNLNRKYAKMSADEASTALFVGMIAGIVGARIFYVVQFFGHYRNNLWGIFRIDQGGLVFYGGFLLAMAALVIYCRRRKLDFVRVLDVFAPAIAIAHACGRVGCFLNGCCYGKPTGQFPGIVYPAGSEAVEKYGACPLHPVQLYEAGEMLILFGLFFYLVRHAKRGVAMSGYLLVYGVLRFFNELLRGDNAKVLDLFTPAQLIGFALIPLGLGLLVYFLRYAKQNSALSS